VPGSLTRRQLLIRTGGATVALTCFGALPGGAAAEPAALSAARAAAYASILDDLHALPQYVLADRADRVALFADVYAHSGEAFRAYADDVLDHFAARGFTAGALDLAALPYLEENDSHPILFTP
jgi:hypothetical protein